MKRALHRRTDSTTKRQAAITAVVLVTLFTGAAGIVAASGLVVDDFNDGSAGDWTSGASCSITANNTLAAEGSHSGYIECTNPADSAGDIEITTPVTTANSTSMWFRHESLPQDNIDWEFGYATVRFEPSGNISVRESGGTVNTTSATYQTNTWYRVTARNITDGGTFDLVITDKNGNTIHESGGYAAASSIDSEMDVKWTPSTYPDLHIDNLTIDAYSLSDPEIVGEVSGPRDTNIGNVSITVTNSTGTEVANTTTNAIGEYNVTVPAGDLNISYSRDLFETKNRSVQIEKGEIKVVNVQLERLNDRIDFEIPNYLRHGQEANYTVSAEQNGAWSDVTDQATVTVSNTSVVQVDSNRQVVEATSDISVNNRVEVTAQYTADNGDVLSTTEEVTVANNTVENFDILPPTWQVNAVMMDSSIQIILVAVLLAVAATLFATSFAGLSIGTLTIIVGWLGGWADTGLVLTAIALAAFIGLNLAANIDYTVRNG